MFVIAGYVSLPRFLESELGSVIVFQIPVPDTRGYGNMTLMIGCARSQSCGVMWRRGAGGGMANGGGGEGVGILI